MFNFHWLARENYSIQDIKNLSNELDFYNYDSVLFTYHSNTSDNFIKIANAIDKKNKIKYMIAIRPHTVSPEYLKMQCEAFNEIDQNRLIINFVAGNIQPDENVPEYDINQRRIILNNFLKEFTESKWNMPLIAVSGSSDLILKSAKNYADFLILELSAYLTKEISKKYINKTIITIPISVKDNKNNINFNDQNNIINGISMDYYGTEKEIIKKILNLKTIGITDIMIAAEFNEPQKNKIHNIVKTIKEMK